MKHLRREDPEVFEAVLKETRRQENNIELIASENFVQPLILEAASSALTNKYAEGYPGARWYGGCEFIDRAETLAIQRAKKLFRAEHANVQPHSGTQANMVVFFAMLEMGDTVLAMDIAAGGHLTHGHPKNYSGKYFNIISYGVRREDERIDYDQVSDLAKKHKPKLILAGASAYPRIIDFKKFREIADSVGAYLMVDMAHIAGLIAAGLHPNPAPLADFVTSTTHKTLRGPRAGFILCKKEFAKEIDTELFPGVQGGPLEHIIAAKAVCFKLASQPEFKEYQKQVIKNAQVLAGALQDRGYRIVSGGTDNHLFLVDLTSKNLTGKEAAKCLDQAGITVNKNLIPFDRLPPAITSGIRIGTPAVTTRRMKDGEMLKIAEMIDEVLSSRGKKKTVAKVKQERDRLVKRFPMYRDLIKEMES